MGRDRADAAAIVAARLSNHRLAGERFANAIAAVRALGAVQAQDYPAAKWALGLRSAATDAELDRLFDSGALLRTHVLRPTWHFILPEDARWLIELTGPRVRAGIAGRLRRLELEEREIARGLDLLGTQMAGGRALTRAEAAAILQSGGIAPDGQRLPHVLMCGELSGLLISGPRRGRQFTWALLEERAAGAARLDPEDALGELARRYFTSRGPALEVDFAWWSGLTLADARRAIEGAGAALERVRLNGRDHWIGRHQAPAAGDASRLAHLLPNFDEYTVAYRDRSALDGGDPFDPSLFAFGSVLGNAVLIGGRVRGAWKRVAARGAVIVEARPMRPLTARESAAVAEAARAHGRFLEKPVELAHPAESSPSRKTRLPSGSSRLAAR